MFIAMTEFFGIVDEFGKKMRLSERSTGRSLQLLSTFQALKQKWANYFTDLMDGRTFRLDGDDEALRRVIREELATILAESGSN
jgi:hypothetical protein